MEPASAPDTLEGALDKVVYRDVGSTFVVARLRPTAGGDPVSVVGPMGSLAPGEVLRLHGRWEDDRKWGRQFRVASWQSIAPATLEGIERYLGGGGVDGIGPELARRLVARFGDRTLDVIQNQPDRLLEVEGIGPVRAGRIRETWRAEREVQDVMVFLQGHGVSPAFAARIHRRYGKDTLALVRENPYRLALEVWGIGFKSADALARRLGFAADSPARAEAGLVHVLDELREDGHCHVPEPTLLHDAEKDLEIDAAILAPALERLLGTGRVVREELGDRGPCISLATLQRAESALAARLADVAATPGRRLDVDVDAGLLAFEAERKLVLAPQQRQAVRVALLEKLTVITGGPGVGKTTIVNAIIRLAEQRLAKIALAAPTGRAAKRLQEATGRPAMTLHRLLQYAPQSGGFQKNADAPLEADLVVVDESSMLDVPLAAALLAAVPADARLVLVGDVDQLPSVGPGRVLGDVIASRAAQVVRLTEIFRQAAASAIVTNAHRVNRGELPELGRKDGDFYFIERDDPDAALATVLELVGERIPRRFGLDAVDDVQVLTPMHRGQVGAQNLNTALQERLNPAVPSEDGGAPAERRPGRWFRPGDKVLQVRNDYDKDVFNGDVGRVVAAGERVVVRFDGREVTYERGELESLTLAYAMSVHKSQGSEYPGVVIPLVTQHFMMLRRNLLYTGMTRGKKLVVLVGSRKALGIAVRTDDTRLHWTWLAERLRAAAAERARPVADGMATPATPVGGE